LTDLVEVIGRKENTQCQKHLFQLICWHEHLWDYWKSLWYVHKLF